MSLNRNLSGVKYVLSDDSLDAVINTVERRLAPHIFDGTKIQHESDCRCQSCWESFQAAWVAGNGEVIQ